MRLLARLEGALPTVDTIDTLISTTLVGPSIAPIEPAIIHVGPSSAPADPLVIVITLHQASGMSLGA